MMHRSDFIIAVPGKGFLVRGDKAHFTSDKGFATRFVSLEQAQEYGQKVLTQAFLIFQYSVKKGALSDSTGGLQ